jgi:hypothetical protein
MTDDCLRAEYAWQELLGQLVTEGLTCPYCRQTGKDFSRPPNSEDEAQPFTCNRCGQEFGSLEYREFVEASLGAEIEGDATVLYRPVGQQELELIRESRFKTFPPRLPEQPIFYPVLTRDYAEQIARTWNTKYNSPPVGYVVRFKVKSEYLRQHKIYAAASSEHREYWIPADELEEFNRNIVGDIELICEFRA